MLTFFTCQEITTPKNPGIGGLDGGSAVPPSWRKKDGKLLFYAEQPDDKIEFTYENPFLIPADFSCRCGADAEAKDCGCNDAADCVCRRITVTVKADAALAAISGEEYGIVFARSWKEDETGLLNGAGAQWLERLELSNAKRIRFTIKRKSAGLGEWNIAWYEDAGNQQNNESGEFSLQNSENTLKIEFAVVTTEGVQKQTYRFFVNDKLIYPLDENSDPVIFTLIDENDNGLVCAVHYYAGLSNSAPSRLTPYKLEFSTKAPEVYP